MKGDSRKTIYPYFLINKRSLFNYTVNLLRKHGIRPSKRLSQNFTVEPKYILSIIESVDPVLVYNGIVEIGTGLGTLTQALSLRFPEAIIISVEKDTRFFNIASEVLGPYDNIVVIQGDALYMIPFMKISTIVSSTPFSITTPIVLSIARNNNIKQAVLGLQKEVAQRLLAEPGTKDYGRLSVLARLLFDITLKGFYPSSTFYPRPKVSAGIVLMKRKKEYKKEVHEKLEKFTACLFSSRNKKAVKIIIGCIEKIGGEIDKSLIISRFDEKRVRMMTPEEIEWIIKKFFR